MKKKIVKYVFIPTLLLSCCMLTTVPMHEDNVINSSINENYVDNEYVQLPMLKAASDQSSIIGECNIALGEDIRFFAYVSNEYVNHTMEFTLKNGEEVLISEVSESEVFGEKLKFTFNKVTPQYLGNDIVMTLKNSEGDVVSSKSYSVKKYCYDLLNSLASAESNNVTKATKTIVVDVLNYGAAAQKYTSTNVDMLVNNDLTAEQKAFASTFDTPTNKLNITKTENASFVASWSGARVWYKSKVGVGFAFAVPTETDKTTLSVKITINNKETVISEADLIVAEGLSIEGKVCYEARYDNISALDFNEAITAVVLVNGEAQSEVLTYSVNTYAANLSSGAMKELIEATYCYGKGANLYKNSAALDQAQSLVVSNDGNEIVVGKEYNDYIFEKHVLDKATAEYKFEGNAYYVKDATQDYVEIGIVNRGLTYQNKSYDAYNLDNGLTYNPLTDSFVVDASAITDESISLGVPADKKGNVVLDVKENVTKKGMTFDGNAASLTIAGTGTLTLSDTLLTNAKETVVDGNLLINKEGATDAISAEHSKFVVNGQIDINSSNNEMIQGKSAMFVNGMEVNGSVNIKNFQQGIFSEDAVSIMGNLSIDNCTNGITTSGKDLNINTTGTVSVSTTGSAIDAFKMNVVDGNVSVATANGENVIKSGDVIVGSETTSPIFNITANGGAAIGNKINDFEIREAHHNFISGTTTLKQNKPGNVGITFDGVNDTVEVQKDAELNIADFARSIASWNGSAKVEDISLTSYGRINMTGATEFITSNIGTIKILDGIFNVVSTNIGISNCYNFTLGTETTAPVFILESDAWGMSVDKGGAIYDFVRGQAIFMKQDENMGYAAMHFTSEGFERLSIGKEMVMGTRNYSFAVYKDDRADVAADKVVLKGVCYASGYDKNANWGFATIGIPGAANNYSGCFKSYDEVLDKNGFKEFINSEFNKLIGGNN